MAVDMGVGRVGPKAEGKPGRLWRGVLLALLLAAAAVGGLYLLCRPVKTLLNYYDEGLVLVNAMNILHGAIPYRDFWSLYSPGYYYLLAGVMKVFGETVMVARIFDVVQRALLALAVYGVARRSISTVWALLPAGLAALWLSSIGFFSYPVFPAVLAALVACLCLFRFFDNRRAYWLFLSGVAVGLAATLRHDLGVFAGLGVALGLLTQAWAERKPFPLRPLLLLVAGAAIVALPLYLYLALAGDVRAMWQDLIVFPATGFRAYRDLPKPPLVPNFRRLPAEALEEWLRFYVPLLIFAVALITALVSGLRHRLGRTARPAADDGALIALTVTGLLAFNQALGRYEALHVLPSQLFALLALVALLARLPRTVRAGLAALLVILLFPTYVLHYVLAYQQTAHNDPRHTYSMLARSGGVPVQPGEEAAVTYIQQHTKPGDPIFVGNTHHDRIVVNDMGFYFLADRRSPAIYQELHPGVATTLPVQQEIVARLQQANVQYIVEVTVWEPREPNLSAVSSGVTYLDDWIRQHYTPCFEAGSYRVLRRS